VRTNRSDQLREYFSRLGLTYSGDRRNWRRSGADRLSGPYRGVHLNVFAERDSQLGDISESLHDPNIHSLYRHHLQVGVRIAPAVTPAVCVIPRREYALVSKHGRPVVDGKVAAFGRDKYTVGNNLLYAKYVAVNRLLDTGVPEFDAEFGVICPDEGYASRLLRPDLLSWFAQDKRSSGTRIGFMNEYVNVFFRTGVHLEPRELFTPEWIFPAADYLIDLLGKAPADVVRPAAVEPS